MLEFAYEFSETPGMSSKANAERFGNYIRKWREDTLRWTQIEVHQAGGPSNSTQTKIENGELNALNNATAKKLDRGLQWEPGSAWTVWEGGEAVRRESLLTPQILSELDKLQQPYRDQIRAVLEDDARRRATEGEVESG